MSQVKLAEAVGVTQQSVQKWESGANEPSLENLRLVASALGTTPQALVGGDDDPPTDPAPAAVLQIAALAGEMTDDQRAKAEAYMRGLLEK